MSVDISDKNENFRKSRRIASNTIALLLRMLVLTIVNLYTVRLILNGLGVEDYGIFNAVAGVVTITSFISSALELSIQRFYSYSIGENNFEKQNNVFSISINIIIVLSIIILVIVECIGLWFLNTQLSIPPYRMNAAEWCFQFSLITFLCSIIQIPFTSAIFANEEMGVYALVSTVECILRLVVAVLIGKFFIDNLIFYSGGLALSALLILTIYICFGHFRYPECKYKKNNDLQLAKNIMSFSGWTLFGSFSKVGMIQGSTILLNIFFGPIANAAFGISMQINNAFNSLCNSMILALRPAMIKAYAEKEYEYLNHLFSLSNKFVFYILIMISLPIISEMWLILRLWLGDAVSSQIVLFARLIIIYVICLAMSNPISTIMHASGHIKEYNVPVESFSFLCLPVSWLLFRLGCAAYSVFISMIGICIIAHFIRLWCLKRFYKMFSIRDYIMSLCIPALLICIIGISVTYVLHFYIYVNIVRYALVAIIPPLIILLLAYFLGISSKERELINKLIKFK